VDVCGKREQNSRMRTKVLYRTKNLIFKSLSVKGKAR
jgi:hypothetical protein